MKSRVLVYLFLLHPFLESFHLPWNTWPVLSLQQSFTGRGSSHSPEPLGRWPVPQTIFLHTESTQISLHLRRTWPASGMAHSTLPAQPRKQPRWHLPQGMKQWARITPTKRSNFRTKQNAWSKEKTGEHAGIRGGDRPQSTHDGHREPDPHKGFMRNSRHLSKWSSTAWKFLLV